MDIRKNTIRNSAYGMFSQMILLPLQFAVRYVMLEYIGVQVLGITDTVASIIGFMALAEGGFGTAITFSLYKPLAEGDTDKVNRLMNVYKGLYRGFAAMVLVIALLLTPFLRFILKGVEITAVVYAIYFLQCANTAASYLLAYKRSLLAADVKEYIAKRVDILCNLLFTVVKLPLIVLTKNYLLVLLVSIAQTVISNLIIHVKCRAHFPYLQPGKMDRAVFREIAKDAKNLFGGKLAAYVYNSTDNILISAWFSTVSVGFLSNYTMISNMIKNLVGMILSPITPTLGRLQAGYTEIGQRRSLFHRYYQICYIIGFAVSIPILMLIDGFIAYAFGPEYVMEPGIKWLLAMIVFLYIAPFAYGEFLTTNRRFEALRRAEMVGAVLNLGLSILFAWLVGLQGVLWGTAASVTVQCVMRSYVVYTDILQYTKKQYGCWIAKGFYRLLLVGLSVCLTGFLTSHIHLSIYLLEFILHGILCVTVPTAVYLLLYRCGDRIKVSDLKALLRKEG